MVELDLPQLDIVFHALGDPTRRGHARQPGAWRKDGRRARRAVRDEPRRRVQACEGARGSRPGPPRGARPDPYLPARARPARQRRPMAAPSTSASGPAASTPSSSCCARTTPARPRPANPIPQRRKAMNQAATPEPYGVADRARHAQARAPAARLDRPGLGLSHRKRPAPPMDGGGRDGHARRRDGRAGLAQQ